MTSPSGKSVVARSFSISSHCDWRRFTVQQFCGDKSARVASDAKNRCHWFGCIFFRFLTHQRVWSKFRDSHLICFTPLICGVICVSVRLKSIEGASVVTVEGKSQLDPLGSIRVCDEITAERDEVCIAMGDGSLRCIGFEAARSDERT